MKEVWDIATGPSVLPYTVLLVPVALYWLLFAFGMTDTDALEIDVDLDADVEVASDGSSADHGFFHSVMSGVLRFLNAAEVPLMLVLSFMIVLIWMVAMLATIIIGDMSLPFRDAIIAVGALVVGVILTKFLTQPLKPFFKMIKSEEKADPIIGKSGKVKSHELSSKGGQVEVWHRGTDALLNARISDGSTLKRGDEVVVFSYDEDSGVYFVKSL